MKGRQIKLSYLQDVFEQLLLIHISYKLFALTQ